MPKDIPPCPSRKPEPSSVKATKEYRIELLTPMFGGGTEAGVSDPLLPIRPTAVRGQLQFWWRATRGAGLHSPEELRVRQTAVWGSTERASPVEVEVREVDVSPPRPCAKYVWNPKARRGQGAYQLEWQSPFRVNGDPRQDALPYALFPFQGKPPKSTSGEEPEKHPASFIEKGQFTLRVRFPEDLIQNPSKGVWSLTSVARPPLL